MGWQPKPRGGGASSSKRRSRTTAAALDARYKGIGHSSGESECNAQDLCFAMQVLDQVRMDRCLPCRPEEQANCQQSYYSAYKCKASLVESQSPWKATGSSAGEANTRGVMCTGNSPSMLARVQGSKCGELLRSTRDYKRNPEQQRTRELLFQWITNEAGPAIWNPISKGAFCKVQRPRRGVKYALIDCSKAAPWVAAFKASSGPDSQGGR